MNRAARGDALIQTAGGRSSAANQAGDVRAMTERILRTRLHGRAAGEVVRCGDVAEIGGGDKAGVDDRDADVLAGIRARQQRLGAEENVLRQTRQGPRRAHRRVERDSHDIRIGRHEGQTGPGQFANIEVGGCRGRDADATRR